MKTIIMIIGLSILFIASGCQANLGMKTRTITIESNPSGAGVYLVSVENNEEIFIGHTPLVNQAVSVPTKIIHQDTPYLQNIATQLDRARVVVRKRGYRSCTTNLATDQYLMIPHKIELEPIYSTALPNLNAATGTYSTMSY